jgi:hypothetical protein
MKAAFSFWRAIFNTPWRHATALSSSSAVALTSVLCRSSSVLSSILHLRSSIPSPRALLAATVLLALTANVASTLAVYPHTISYFNEVAGGPLNGSAHLLDANVDWGQNLLMLKGWYDAHPEARPFHLAYFGNASPQVAGIEAKPVPHAPAGAFHDERALKSGLGHQSRFLGSTKQRFIPTGFSAPGWHAVSVNEFLGYKHTGGEADYYVWLRVLEPVACVGNSILVFHVASGSSSPTFSRPNSSSDK